MDSWTYDRNAFPKWNRRKCAGAIWMEKCIYELQDLSHRPYGLVLGKDESGAKDARSWLRDPPITFAGSSEPCKSLVRCSYTTFDEGKRSPPGEGYCMHAAAPLLAWEEFRPFFSLSDFPGVFSPISFVGYEGIPVKDHPRHLPFPDTYFQDITSLRKEPCPRWTAFEATHLGLEVVSIKVRQELRENSEPILLANEVHEESNVICRRIKEQVQNSPLKEYIWKGIK